MPEEQDKMLAKKRGRPATGQGLTIGVRVHPELLTAIDQWIAEDGKLIRAPGMSRAEAVRRLATEQLQALGLLAIP